MQNCPSAKSVAGILAAGRDTKEIIYLGHFHAQLAIDKVMNAAVGQNE